MIKISIIVPIYNVEDYLIKCLDSLINQKYKNIEIILVDDGSTDNSLSICKMYEKKDKRIKIVNQENKGLSSARNLGLRSATGEFVWFVDGDDYIDDNSIDILLKYLDDDTDIVVFNYYKVSESILKKKAYFNFNNLESKYILSFPIACNKVFRRTILYDDMFPIGHIYEDLYVIPTLILKTKRIKFIDDCLYYYVYRENSISNKGNNVNERKYVLKNVEELLIDKYYDEVEYLYVYHLLVPSLITLKREIRLTLIKEIKEVNRYIKSIFPNYYKNRYLGKRKLIFFIIYFLI